MKRVTTLLAVLLSLSAASIAVAFGGPGTFKINITGNSAKSANGTLDGTWVIDLANARAGNLKLTRNGKPLGGGKYLISGSAITLTPKKGGKCTTKANYHFKLHANTLTFKAISDTCTTRRDVLTYGPWTMAR
jgi:hypothetical protein